MRWILAACALAWCSLSWGQGVFPAKSWDKPEPGQPRWSATGLQAADAIAATTQTDGYLVVHRGVLVHSFGETTKPRNVYSGRKSILSILFGMSVDRGLIDLDQSLESLQVDDVDELTAQEKTATVRQVLQARSGVYHPAAYESAGMKAARPARGSHPPGAFWYYNNWDFNAAGSIFQLRTGKSVFEALRDDIATPLQFEDFRMERDTEWVKEGVSRHPAYVMRLSGRDLARVGLLMARDGRWGDRQLVSPRWVAESTAVSSPTPAGWLGYGYMWWVPERAWPFWKRAKGDVFFAWGNFGQFVFVDRRRDLVIVHQADIRLLFSKQVTTETVSPLLAGILSAAPRE